MTNLFTNLSKNGSEPVNGSRMDRHYIENGPIHSRQLFAVLVMLLCLGVGNVWGAVTALTIPQSWAASGGSSAYTEALGCTKHGLGSDYSASGTKLKFDNTGDYMIIQLASSPAYVSYAILGNSFSGGTFKVQESSNGSTYTDVATYTSSPSGTKTNNLKAATRYIKFVYTTKSSGNIGLGTIVIKARTSVTLDKNGGTANGTAVIPYNATAKESITAPTNAGSTLLGYWEGASTGNKVLNADGSFAASSVSGWITSNKWTKDAATAKLYARWEAACDNNVNISKGSETNGTFTLSKTGSQATCNGLSVDVTPTPSTHYHVASVTATTPTTGGAPTITGPSAGKYTVAYAANSTGNSTINVAFEEDPTYTVTWVAGGSSSFHTQTNYAGTALTAPGTPDASTYCPGGKVFVGWTATEIDGTTNTQPADLFTSVSGMSIPATNKTYYAVFATSGSSSKTYSFSITASDFNSTSYAANNNEKTSTATATDASGAKMSVNWTSNQIMLQSSAMQWQKSNGYIYNSTDLGTINSVTVTSSAGTFTTYYGTTSQPSSGTQGTGNGYFKTSVGSATGSTSNVAVNFTKTTTSYSNYATTCCTQLGSINGSVSWSNAATAVVSWDNLDHVSSWTVKYKTHAAGAYTTWAGDQSTAAGRRSVTITGLTPCTNYDFQIIANPASGYCDKDQTIEDSQTHNWTVTSTGVTNATASPAIPSTTCSGFSTTISPATGYALPADITVTNASKSWNSSTGALSISSVTGNVSITITPTCVSPVISGDPADANYYIGDSPDALSVSATLASGTLTYLWKVSTNGGSTWSDAAGTNNAATYSGASLSTASVGTLKFKCIVGNSEGGCTVESEEATITVANASYFPNGVTVFIQADSKDYSAWKDDACVKAWFNASGAGGAAQTTYWLFDATDTDAGKKLFAAIVPSTGDLNQVTLQRFQSDCLEEHWYNNNGTLTQASSSGVNTFRSYGSADNNIAWNGSSTTLSLYGNQNSWASSLATFADQGSGVWTATISNYAPDETSKDYKIKTSYNNGWIGNTGSNNNATLSGMIVGSTYNVTATLDVTDHSLVMSKEFVKGTVHFDLQDHGLAISDLENVAAGSKISAPSAPSATGYTFGGWYKEPTCTNAWTFASDVVNETMTLYAKWTANVYTITKTFSNVANAGLPTSFTYSGATTTALNSTFTVDATNFFLPSSIAVTMGGTPLTAGSDYTYNNSTGEFTFDRIISGNIVITASATAKLKSIAITTQPTTRKYFAGESFSSTGAVVTATMGDGSTKAVTASATWTPPATPLAAGTGLTVTASYTENAINMTATTTIDVYSVTVNKKNEDGDAIDVAGVTATWTVGTKALAAGVGSTKYAFKEWQVTGATPASTTSASTTLSSPTANVVVNAVFYKPRVVKWSVNGDDSYATGGPTTEVAYNGTISTVPTAPADNTLSCTNKFMGWSTKDAGTTPKTTSYYDDLFTNASGYTTNITAATTTFYAVFAEAETGAWTLDYSEETALSSSTDWGSYGDAYNYTASDGGIWTVKAYKNSGMQINTGRNASIKIPDCSGNITSIVITCSAAKAVGLSASNYTGSGTITYIAYGTDATSQTIDCSSKTATGGYIVPKSGSTSITKIVVNYGSTSNYVTECDANIVKVTYNANGGSTSCTNTTTDKTEDFTVCSSAPTRDYYTFAGWLCSADDEVYAASATIDDAVIDADFTLTAQWTPVPYNITYELDGGTNNVGNPATYNVTTATITLQDPTKGHDRFDGWYKTYSAGVYSNPVTSIPLGSHGDITLYAKWAARHEIIFDADGATTTIYRADDEALNASVAGQGSIPANPSAPSACSSKVFVGWVAEEIDGETDDEPTFLDVTSKVNADKHYYAVWATSVGNSIAAVEDESFTGGEYATYFSKTYGLKSNDKYVYKNSIWTSSDMTAGTKVKIKVKHLSNSSAATLTIALINSSGTVVTSTTLSTTANSNNIDNAAYSSNVELIATTAVTGYQITLSNIGSSSGVVILAATREVVATRSAYSTSCCATKVTLSENSPEHGTIAFGKTSVGTCGGDKNVSLTITPAAGYQLSSYEVATGSGKVAAKSVSPDIALGNNSSAAQNITLTFAEDANGAYNVTATFTLMTVTSWTWTMNSAAIPDPLNLYVGQSARLDVAYTPAGVDASKKTYTRNKVDAYINWSGAQQSTYSTISGRASTGDNTTAVTFTHADGPTKTVNVKVLPLPLTHFVDLVHGKAFADVAATIEANALSATKTTPTSDDWTTPNANTCEENHLHLVGWIREDWPALVAYLNGTGDAPTTVAITGAGNDGEGHAYFFAPNASINVQTFNGVTFYAVWAQIE